MPQDPDKIVSDMMEEIERREAFLAGLKVGLAFEGEVSDKEEFRHLVDSAWYEYEGRFDDMAEDGTVDLDFMEGR